MHDEWRQNVKNHSDEKHDIDLNKAKEALKKALIHKKRATARTVIKENGMTVRTFVINDEAAWKDITEQVRIEHWTKNVTSYM